MFGYHVAWKKLRHLCGAVRGLHSKVALKEQVVVLDVGGGSTELISGSKFGAVSQGGSAQLGAVRLTELAVDNLQKCKKLQRINCKS